jgi:hypothetical protein
LRWTCPDCGRTFGRNRQSHECAPALSLEEYFATGPEWERPIFEAVRAHLESLGPVLIEPVSVGIFFKSNGTLVELRPKTKWVAMSFPLSRRLAHPRIARKPIASGRKIYHFVNLTSAADIDDELRGWLTESFQQFG